MALFTWSKRYSVGIKAMDDQHSNFMRLLNEFHAATLKGRAQSAVGPILRRVADHVRDHFAAEEALMEAHKYPGLAEQKVLHKDLICLAGEYLARLEKNDPALCIPLLKAMRDGFTNHILVEDMKYAPWMKDHVVQ